MREEEKERGERVGEQQRQGKGGQNLLQTTEKEGKNGKASLLQEEMRWRSDNKEAPEGATVKTGSSCVETRK